MLQQVPVPRGHKQRTGGTWGGRPSGGQEGENFDFFIILQSRNSSTDFCDPAKLNETPCRDFYSMTATLPNLTGPEDLRQCLHFDL